MRAVAAVVLAAGGSTRLGQSKQLLRVDGESLVRRSAMAAVEGGCTPVVVVVGNLRAEIEAELAGVSATIVENVDWARGIGTSIRVAIGSLKEHPAVDAVVLLACDQPLVNRAVVKRLLDEARDSGKPIVASSYADTLGVPALFARPCFEELLALPDDSGAKPVIESRRVDVAKIEFEDGAIDIDTPADLQRLKR